MRTLWRGIPAAVALLLIAAGSAPAQDAPRGLSLVREGGRAGSGAGSRWVRAASRSTFATAPATARSCTGPRCRSALGGTVNQHLRLGGEVLAWINEQNRTRSNRSPACSSSASCTPRRPRGFTSRVGSASGRNAVDFDDGGGVGDTGFAGPARRRLGAPHGPAVVSQSVGRCRGAPLHRPRQRALPRAIGQLRARCALPERALNAGQQVRSRYSLTHLAIAGRVALPGAAVRGAAAISPSRAPRAKASISRSSDGNGQTGTVGQALPEPLVVGVESAGTPIQGHRGRVRRGRRSAAGRLEPDTAVTGPGRARRGTLGARLAAGAARGGGQTGGDRTGAASERGVRGLGRGG